MTDFTNYTDANLSALKASSKAAEIVSKKQSILDGVYDYYNYIPGTVLFCGFNPAIISSHVKQEVYVTEISDAARAYLDEKKVKYTYVPLATIEKSYDAVVAADEYFTFASNANTQIEKVSKICSLAKDFVISTLRDYKNQDFKDREFSTPAVIRNGADSLVFNEFHNWATTSRTQWESKVYEINNATDALTVYGSFKRHTMYFKQLAKFSMDAGADDFIVHKNLMYKSPIKKNYEHVVSIKFDETYDRFNTNRTDRRD
jgi:hypothetical protein